MRIGPLAFLFLAGAVVFMPCTYSRAEDFSQARTKFYRANTYYSTGEYDQAVSQYEEIISSGVESGGLYYNLANSYFKKEKLGMAIVNYEKAKRLMPRDSDLKANYDYAKSLIRGGNFKVRKVWFAAMFEKIFSLFTIDALNLWASLFFTSILLTILSGMYFPHVRKYRVILMSIFSVAFVLSSLAVIHKLSSSGKEAIVIVEHTDAKFEPFDTATSHFALYEGTKVHLLSAKDSWCKIERSDKKIGWVKKTDIDIM
ncbi:MAG: tetratricopeptide repeat protein [Candidatus Omnitrophota bacterium]